VKYISGDNLAKESMNMASPILASEVCVCEREREFERVCVRERERV